MRAIDVADWDSFYADMGDSRNTMDSYDRGYTDALDRVDDWMDAQLTVDAVEVVRCKDCKYYNPELQRCNHPCLDYDVECFDHWIDTEPDDFCSYGKRGSEHET